MVTSIWLLSLKQQKQNQTIKINNQTKKPKQTHQNLAAFSHQCIPKHRPLKFHIRTLISKGFKRICFSLWWEDQAVSTWNYFFSEVRNILPIPQKCFKMYLEEFSPYTATKADYLLFWKYSLWSLTLIYAKSETSSFDGSSKKKKP